MVNASFGTLPSSPALAGQEPGRWMVGADYSWCARLRKDGKPASPGPFRPLETPPESGRPRLVSPSPLGMRFRVDALRPRLMRRYNSDDVRWASQVSGHRTFMVRPGRTGPNPGAWLDPNTVQAAGEWRNGRRWGLKIPWPKGHAGSIPASPSTLIKYLFEYYAGCLAVAVGAVGRYGVLYGCNPPVCPSVIGTGFLSFRSLPPKQPRNHTPPRCR
jgi:hypothetical protein